jgi:hypothetical protein
MGRRFVGKRHRDVAKARERFAHFVDGEVNDRSGKGFDVIVRLIWSSVGNDDGDSFPRAPFPRRLFGNAKVEASAASSVGVLLSQATVSFREDGVSEKHPVHRKSRDVGNDFEYGVGVIDVFGREQSFGVPGDGHAVRLGAVEG